MFCDWRMTAKKRGNMFNKSSHVRQSEIPESGKLGLWNSEYMQLKETWIPRKTGIQNTRSTENDWNPEYLESRWNPRRGIQNLRLCWIPLHGAKQMKKKDRDSF